MGPTRRHLRNVQSFIGKIWKEFRKSDGAMHYQHVVWTVMEKTYSKFLIISINGKSSQNLENRKSHHFLHQMLLECARKSLLLINLCRDPKVLPTFSDKTLHMRFAETFLAFEGTGHETNF